MHGWTPKKPRRQPRQRRSEHLVRAILEAAFQILEREGIAALTTNHVAERAGVSVGSLYYYFPDKEAILDALFEHVIERREAEIRQMRGRVYLQALPPKVALRELIRQTVDQHRRFLRLHREYYKEAGSHYEIGRRGMDLERTYEIVTQEWVQELLDRNRSWVRADDVSHAARMAVYIIGGTLRHLVEQAPDLIDGDAVVDDVLSAVCGYLRTPA
jgi:AcrR family transcriptional regulator